MQQETIGFVGTYTRETSEGIYRFTLDYVEESLKNVQVAAKVGSPTYLSIAEKHLYAVAQNGEQGGIAAYELTKETGGLRYLNRKLADGAPPCHVTTEGEDILTANYHKGTVHLYKKNGSGSIQKEASVVEHEGSGPHERQEKPHVHYAAYTPDGKYVLAADLGTDELVTYAVEQDKLVHVSTLQVKPGSGPRHVAFHPKEKIAYLLTELSSEIIVLDYNSDEGTFAELQTIKAIPEDFEEINDASAIHVSKDGKFLYTGNRGHNSIALFAINENGTLTFVEHTSTEGKWPRDFAIDPTEKFIVVANQHSNNLVLFKRDEETGKLSYTGSEVTVPEGVCVKFP